MIHRKLRYETGWEWHIIQEERSLSVPAAVNVAPPTPLSRSQRKSRPAATDKGPITAAHKAYAETAEPHMLGAGQLALELPFCGPWIREATGRRHNQVSYALDEAGKPLLSGTVMIQPTEQSSSLQPMHFWLCGNRLVTWHEDPRLPLRLQASTWSSSLESCVTAQEAFLVLLGAMLEVFHSGLDDYERKLTKLEESVRRRNRTALLPVIFELRHELLHWTHQFLAIQEVQDSAKEAYMDELMGTAAFQRLSYKLERIDSLLTRYTVEIDTLIAMDDAIASFRGNDIMKTLTIFTALFVPPTIAGSLWGVNFRYLPGVESRWGFVILCTAIVLFAAVLYAWLWYKGWTGDLLTDRSSSRKGRGRSGRGQAATSNTYEAYGGTFDWSEAVPDRSRATGDGSLEPSGTDGRRQRSKTQSKAARKAAKNAAKPGGKNSRSSRPYPGLDDSDGSNDGI
ncbi:Mg2+ and Co2+ transporter CorA [Paenibacillaceae bacterium GAS479]|nr:Mg2+ and Co2+ transporter CorA [Paenibacillaceae bacterium GAS479]